MVSKYQSTDSESAIHAHDHSSSVKESYRKRTLHHLKKPSRAIMNVFGKILYALAMADGAVQNSEINILHKIVSKDKWARQIEFSFKVARKLDMDPKTVFEKNMRVFRARPIDEHYPYFLELMQKIAQAHDGIVPAEQAMIEKFKRIFNSSHTRHPASA